MTDIANLVRAIVPAAPTDKPPYPIRGRNVYRCNGAN